MKLGNKIERILRVDDESFSVTLRFRDGASGVVSLVHLFERPKGLAAEILKGGMFAMCFLENGALAWPNGFELCPDALRTRVTPAMRSRNGAAKPSRRGSSGAGRAAATKRKGAKTC